MKKPGIAVSTVAIAIAVPGRAGAAIARRVRPATPAQNVQAVVVIQPPLGLDGIVNSVGVALSSSLPAGSAGATLAVVNAYDAKGISSRTAAAM